jgi:hypothetical protein
VSTYSPLLFASNSRRCVFDLSAREYQLEPKVRRAIDFYTGSAMHLTCDSCARRMRNNDDFSFTIIDRLSAEEEESLPLAQLVSCPDLSAETFSRSGVSVREVWIITLGVCMVRSTYKVHFTAYCCRLRGGSSIPYLTTATMSSILVFQLYKLYALGRKWLINVII